jgi:hypothetical protein
MVKDANGSTVGQYSNTPGESEFVIAKTSGGQLFVLPINAAGFSVFLNNFSGTNSALEYASPDCTGTPYLGGTSGYGNGAPYTLVQPGNLYGSIAYVGGSLQQPVLVQSTFGSLPNSYPLNGSPAPTCQIVTPYTDPAPFSVVGTLDVSVFAPPFTVQ